MSSDFRTVCLNTGWMSASVCIWMYGWKSFTWDIPLPFSEAQPPECPFENLECWQSGPKSIETSLVFITRPCGLSHELSTNSLCRFFFIASITKKKMRKDRCTFSLLIGTFWLDIHSSNSWMGSSFLQDSDLQVSSPASGSPPILINHVCESKNKTYQKEQQLPESRWRCRIDKMLHHSGSLVSLIVSICWSFLPWKVASEN